MTTEEMLMQLLDSVQKLQDGQQQMNSRLDSIENRLDNMEEQIEEIKENSSITRFATNKNGAKLEELVTILNETGVVTLKY